MTSCDRIRSDFLDLLRGGMAPHRGSELEEHLRECGACGEELVAARATWDALPAWTEIVPPPEVRERLLTWARHEVRTRPALARALLDSLREAARPILAGLGAAALVLYALALRGGVAPAEPGILVAKGLLLGAVLAVAAAGLMNRGTPHPVRSVLWGGVAALGGYLGLILLLPIPEGVEFCRVALLGDATLTVHQLCLVYLGVAAVYAGIPMGVAAFLWPGRFGGPGAGLLAGGVFLALSAPTLLLQVGLQEGLIVATLVLGAAVGSMAGGAGGGWFRSRRPVLGR